MRISLAAAVPLLLISPLGCGSSADDDFKNGTAGVSAQSGSSGLPTAGSAGNPGGSGGSPSGGGKGGAAATAGTTGASGGSGGNAPGTGGAGGAQANGGAGGGGNTGGSGGNAGAGAASGMGGIAAGGMAGNEAGAGGTTAGSGGAGSAGMGQTGGGVGGKSGAGGKGSAGAGGALANCTADGHITYTLTKNANPTATEQTAYDRITEAMDRALSYYNCYTDITRALSITYVPSVQTADGNPNGSIRFGSMDSMNYITAMHETSHVLGVGDSAFDALIVDGVFTGAAATAELREITGDPEAEVHGDNQHFWPYGLNYTSEVMSEADLLNHMRMVLAIRMDLGL